MSTCPKCQAAVYSENQYCSHCGHKLDLSSQACGGRVTQKTLKSAEVRYKLGIIYFKRGKYQKAIETWEKLLDEESDNFAVEQLIDNARKQMLWVHLPFYSVQIKCLPHILELNSQLHLNPTLDFKKTHPSSKFSTKYCILPDCPFRPRCNLRITEYTLIVPEPEDTENRHLVRCLKAKQFILLSYIWKLIIYLKHPQLSKSQNCCMKSTEVDNYLTFAVCYSFKRFLTFVYNSLNFTRNHGIIG